MPTKTNIKYPNCNTTINVNEILQIYNPNFNYGEFAIITSQAGLIRWSNLTTLKQSNSTGLKY